jgi:predicted ABC-type transport system involved in lysophospholipase L1 biosynthesis ATPase subunit
MGQKKPLEPKHVWLMRMIAGLERPTSGDIVIDGNIVNDLHGSCATFTGANCECVRNA